MRFLIQDNRCRGRDSNWDPLEHEPTTLPLRQPAVFSFKITKLKHWGIFTLWFHEKTKRNWGMCTSQRVLRNQNNAPSEHWANGARCNLEAHCVSVQTELTGDDRLPWERDLKRLGHLWLWYVEQSARTLHDGPPRNTALTRTKVEMFSCHYRCVR
jgi:hypothetical protein